MATNDPCAVSKAMVYGHQIVMFKYINRKCLARRQSFVLLKYKRLFVTKISLQIIPTRFGKALMVQIVKTCQY